MPNYVYPAYSNNSSHAHAFYTSNTTDWQAQGNWSSGSAYTIAYDTPMTVTLAPHPTEHRYRTETEQLLADVESVCALAR